MAGASFRAFGGDCRRIRFFTSAHAQTHRLILLCGVMGSAIPMSSSSNRLRVFMFSLICCTGRHPKRLMPNRPSFPELTPIAWVGWVGVEIFFELSGFVIAYSAEGASAFVFFRSRFFRLMPAEVSSEKHRKRVDLSAARSAKDAAM